MVAFVIPTAEGLVEQLSAVRRAAHALFEKERWSSDARKLIKRIDRLIACYED